MVNGPSTKDSPVDGPTETHFKVNVPTSRTVRLRKAEPGMELSRDVHNDNGQLLYPAGTEIDEDIIRRLRNFGKRAIAVREYEQRWVDEDEYQQLPPEAEQLTTREVPLPDETTDEEASGGDSSVALGTFEYLREAETFGELENLGENLLNSVDADDFRKDIHEVLDGVRDRDQTLDEAIQYVLASLAEGDNSRLRQQLLDHVEETGEDPDPLDVDSPVLQDLMMEFERMFQGQQQSKFELQDLLHESLGQVADISPESLPLEDDGESGEKTRSLDSTDENQSDDQYLDAYQDFLRDVLRDKEDRRSLLALVGELLEEQGIEELHAEDLDQSTTTELDEKTSSLDALDEEDLEALNQTLDVFDTEDDLPEQTPAEEPPGESDPVDPGELLTELFDSLEQHRWKEALRELEQYFEQHHAGADSMDLDELLGRSAGLSDLRDSVTEDIPDLPSVDSEQEFFEKFMSFESETDFENLQELPESVQDELETYREEGREFLLDFREEFAEELPAILEKLEESNGSEVLGKFQEMGDRITLEELREPLLETLYETTVPEGPGPDDKRNEKLNKAVDEDNIQKIKKVTRLPDSVIEEFDQLYRKPEETNKWQRKLINKHQSILEDLIYRLQFPGDEVQRFLEQTLDVYGMEQKPFSLFLQPPSVTHYHLVHSYNTSLLSLMLCRELDLPEKVQEALYLGGALADIGLTVIPDSLYLQEGSLTRRAENEMRKHPVYSGKIVSQIFGADHTVAQLVEQHHERPDGSGYPRRLDLGDLSSLTAVLTVADVYTALVENRVYRPKRMPDGAMRFLEEREEKFNAKILNALRRAVGYYPNGSIVKLSNGRLAFVRSQNPEEPQRPRVLCLTNESREKLDSPVRCNLAESDISVKAVLRT